MTRSTRCVLFVVSGIILLGRCQSASAQALQHYGSADPTSEGFALTGGGSESGFTDMGLPVWQVSAPGSNDQVFYTGGGLSQTTKNEAFSKGWILSQTTRVIGQGAQAATAANIDFGNRRFDMNLFLDANGDTTVRLNTSITDNNGVVTVTGPTYTLVGAGSSYHQFDLRYDPSSQTANLFVDNVERISGYAGHTDFLNNNGVLFGAFFQGTGRFHAVSFNVVPAPAALLTAFTGAMPGAGLFLLRRRRK